MTAIYKRELKSYFITPMGFVFLTIFLFILGTTFVFNNIYSNIADMQAFYSAITPLYLIIFTVILTMRIMTEDKKNRTEVLLLTSPVSAAGIALGKFLAAFTVYAIGVFSTLIFAGFIYLYTTIPFITVVSGILGLLLYGALFISVGLFISSLTDSQVVAAIATFCALFFLYLAESFIQFIPNTLITNILYWLSLSQKYTQMSQGIFSLSHLVYFISLTALFIFLTIRVVEKKALGIEIGGTHENESRNEKHLQKVPGYFLDLYRHRTRHPGPCQCACQRVLRKVRLFGQQPLFPVRRRPRRA